MATLSGGDEYCRYLCAPGSNTNQHRFGQFLKELGIELPLDLRTIVQYGWIKPVLRVRLPESFYLNWTHYPVLSSFNVQEGDEWAANLYVRCATARPLSLENPDLVTTNWYTHWLDRDDHPLNQQARAHAILAGPGTIDPPAIQHPRGNQTVYPWIDFFAYWQAYELVEVLKAAVLFQPILATPDASDVLQNILGSYEDFQEYAQLRISGIQESWIKRQPVFDWVSRYRTLVGAWVHAHEDDWESVQEAAPQLLQDLGLSADDLKKGIRDVLLTLWRSWEPWQGKHEVVPKLVRLHLQEDISRAVDFLRDATGEEINLDDSFWGSQGRRSRRWTPLADALPYEAFTAKAAFPVQAPLYLKTRTNQLLPQPFDEDRIHDIVVDWWPKSVTFRRFCLAFKRLHQFTSTKDDRLGLRENTPIDFLILCALHSEKILRDRYLDMSKGVSKAPDFIPMILESARLVLNSFKIKGSGSAIQALRTKLRERGDLHDLHTNPRNPFVSEADFTHSDPLARHLLACFSNFAILRNYAAHHDALDDQLVSDPMAADAIESMLVVTVTMLNASP